MIDGAAGGQVVRTALALSTVTGRPFSIKNIRASRPKPGLKAQHMKCIEALEELSNAAAKGAHEGAREFEFFPGRAVPKTLSIDIGTAGSITLLMQSLLLPCCLAPGKVRLKIRGGTDVKWSMPLDYLLNVVLPHFPAEFKVNQIKRGFYPKGGGLLDMTTKPASMKPIHLTSKPVVDKIKGVSCASSGLREAEVAERQARGAKKKLSSLGVPVKIKHEYVTTTSAGTVITLWSGMGADALGEPRKRAEAVGAEAGARLLYLLCSDAAADHHLADNLVPLMAIFGGKVATDEITGHIRANIAVCEYFFGKIFNIKENTITCKTSGA